jgi:flagellar biosynthesis component FlhA
MELARAGSITRNRAHSKEVQVLFALAVVLLVIAVVGGIAVHPLLFLIAILALLAFARGRAVA